MIVGSNEKVVLDLDIDELTGLPNLRGLEKELDRLIVSIPGSFAICYVDLDGLKAVNDTEGHEAGNEYIKAAALNLAKSVRTSEDRPSDVVTIARLYGDEFVALLRGVNEQERLDIILERIRQQMDTAGTPASLNGVIHEVGKGRAALLGEADAGMYTDKSARKRVMFEALPRRKRVAAWLGEKMLRYAGMNPPRQ